jgi:hypothetical protein
MRRLILIVALVMAVGSVRPANAASRADQCSMLTPDQIQSVIGRPFGTPETTQAAPAFGKQPWGSNCRYSSQSGGHVIVSFIVYVEASASEAKQTFDKLMTWYQVKSRPTGIGDSAYIDSQGAIHVLKGKTRYFIRLEPGDEKQLKALGVSVAQRI